MSKILAYLVCIINLVSEWSGKIIMWLLIPMTLIVFGEVVLRYVFNAPTSWGYEMTAYLFGTLSMLGGAYCMRFDVHVRMNIVRDRLSPPKLAILDISTSTLIFIFCLMLIWKAWTHAWEITLALETSGTVWNPPYWPYALMLPLAIFLLLLQALSNLMNDLFMAITRRSLR